MAEYLGVQRKVMVFVETNDKQTKEHEKQVDEFLKGYNLIKEKSSDAFDMKITEYDASYVTEEWEEIEAKAKEELLFAVVEFFKGENDDEPEWTTDYETLQITI